MTIPYAAVWLDHKEAKIFHIEPEGFETNLIKAPHHHLTRKSAEQGRHALSHDFYQAIAEGLKDAKQLLIVGPSSGKLDFIRYLHKHDHALEARIIGVETLDHPTDNQMAAYVRHYFPKDAANHQAS